MRIAQRASKREALNLRIKPHVRELIDRAAAEDALLDRTVFMVDPAVYRQFLARLDAPPKPNTRLVKSMRTRAPWE